MWIFVAIGIAVLFTLSRIPKPQQPKSITYEDLNIPTAEDGREIPVLFGTRDIKSSNVVWYGDLKTEAIKKKGGKK